MTLNNGYNPDDLYNWNRALKVLLTISTDVFRFKIAREFALDCFKRVGEDTVGISNKMEVITSNWGSISERMWGSEYPFGLTGKVLKDLEAPFTENLACILVSLLTFNEKAMAKPKPNPDYDGSRRKKEKALLPNFGKKKKGESSSGISESTKDVAEGIECLSKFWMSSSDSESSEGASEVSAAGDELEEIQVVAD